MTRRAGRLSFRVGVLVAVLLSPFVLAAPAAAHHIEYERTGQVTNRVLTYTDTHTGCIIQYQFGVYGVPYAQVRTAGSVAPRCGGAWAESTLRVVYI
jgi:hypothetical protein